MITKKNFATQLLQEVSEFQAVYEEHLADYGEILPHVLFGDLFDFLVAHKDNQDIVRQVVGFINKAAASSTSYIIGLVQVSFFEYVAFSDIASTVKPLLNEKALAIYENVAYEQPDKPITSSVQTPKTTVKKPQIVLQKTPAITESMVAVHKPVENKPTRAARQRRGQHDRKD